MSLTLPKRSEVDETYTWDAYSIFASDEQWEAAIAQAVTQIDTVTAYQGRLAEGAATFLAAMADLEKLATLSGKIFIYASLFWAVDTADQTATARYGRARGLFGRVQAATAFVDPELLALGRPVLESWLADEPGMAIFAHYVDGLFKRQAHIRSAEVEEILGQLSDVFRTASSTHSVLADADLTFAPAIPAGDNADPLPVAQGTMGALITHPDREVRRTSFESYADAYLAHKNSMANALSAGIKQDVFNMRVRGYNSSLEASLTPNHIPVQVFHNTIDTFRRHLPTWHRYWRLRRQVLGYDQLHVYDIKAPLTATRPAVPYADAVRWIVAGMKPLGHDYVAALERGLRHERWVDVYPNQGKRSGAFSTGVKGTHPFILMSYSDDVFSLSTLAHELGHSMHSYLAWQNQPFIYSRYTLFVAEVASNFNQAMVRDFLLRTQQDPDFQIALLEEAMSNYHRYFFIMPTLARFELAIHEQVERGQALTAESMMTLMTDLFREGYGDEMAVDADRVGITWAQFPTHLYSNFYVYQYTTGIAGANALARRVLAGEPGAVEAYLAFLRAGNSLYPLDALRLAGVDMTSPEPVEAAFGVLASYVDRLEALLL